MEQPPRIPRGPGRPPKPPGTKKVHLRVVIPPELDEWLRDQAAREGTNNSELVAEALELLRQHRQDKDDSPD